MVHQLMSQLSRARMEKMSVLKGADGMTLQVGTLYCIFVCVCVCAHFLD